MAEYIKRRNKADYIIFYHDLMETWWVQGGPTIDALPSK